MSLCGYVIGELVEAVIEAMIFGCAGKCCCSRSTLDDNADDGQNLQNPNAKPSTHNVVVLVSS